MIRAVISLTSLDACECDFVTYVSPFTTVYVRREFCNSIVRRFLMSAFAPIVDARDYDRYIPKADTRDYRLT